MQAGGAANHGWGSRGAPFGEGTLSPLEGTLSLCRRGDGGGGVNEEPKPP